MRGAGARSGPDFSSFIRREAPTVNGPNLQAPARPPLLDARGRRYEPAVGPRLKVLLFVIFAATAVLGTTGIYLLSIDLLEWWRRQSYTSPFTLWMFVVHVVVGVAITLPFLFFGVAHYLGSRHRRNRRAIRLGLLLFFAGVATVVTGLALVQLTGLPQLPTGSVGRWVVYVLHAVTPLAAVVLYVLHRRAGPKIRWKWGYAWGAGVAAFVAAMAVLHVQDPRKWYAVGPREGEKYFHPSAARTATGDFIPAGALMMDHYCLKCHQDVYNDHYHSAHHFSSFNNPPYRFSVRESRKIVDANGTPRASRWCAGCHDPVPFFSGAFDDPHFDDVNHPTSQAGITCTVCHAVTNVNSTRGNADYTIEEPQHYPFAYSDNALLQWVNNQLVKAKPDFHKKTFLKPFHKTAEFCSTCHKVSLPVELNSYKEFLRGQDHYNSYLLSGVSGHGARSFYYPPQAKTNCAECHMPLRPSGDFGSKDFDGSGQRKGHNHLFPAANTGLPWLLSLDPKHASDAEGLRKAARAHADFLTGADGSGPKMRIDLFGLKEGGTIHDKLVAPLRPELPTLRPGRTYLVEVVVRTLTVGHPFTQGTADSNEIWVDFAARSGGRVVGRSGALAQPDDSGPLDEWAHRINVLMLDRNGQRINRRNPQDIFTPLYNHQLPPGAGQVVHYKLELPADLKAPVELEVRLRYRKFDFEYLSLVYEGGDKVPKLPVIDVCSDRVTLPVEGVDAEVEAQASPVKPAWQRWNDYGIGCYLEGGLGSKQGELRQAEEAFRAMLQGEPAEAHAHAHVNLARVYIDEGRWADAVAALNAARQDDPPAPWWTLAWFNGQVHFENARDRKGFDAAVADFEKILDPANQPREKKFDFALDYVVRNRLAQALYKRAQWEGADRARREPFLLRAVEQYERTLQLDPEDVDAHYGLKECYSLLGRARPLPKAEGPAPATDEKALRELAFTLKSGSAPQQTRLEAAASLIQAVGALGKQPPDAAAPKRPLFESLLAELRPYFHEEKDADLRAATARVLSALHLQLHGVFKPDEVAQERTVNLYRRQHPAADRAAEAVVIYPANRKGAPGF
jgi:tetratricopeptide (TPR) repeat protein